MGRRKILDLTLWFLFVFFFTLVTMCSCKDIHAIIAYCLFVFLFLMLSKGSADGRVGGR